MPNFVQLTDTRGCTFQLNYDRIIKILPVGGKEGCEVALDNGFRLEVKQTPQQVMESIATVEFYRKQNEFKSQIKWAKAITEEEYGG